MGVGNTILEEEINDLEIKAYQKDGASDEIVVSLTGVLDTYNAALFEEVINKLMVKGYRRFIFACAKLNYVSSIGIGSFMNLLSVLKKTNGSIVFAEVQESVLRVFNNLGFSVFFTFTSKLDGPS